MGQRTQVGVNVIKLIGHGNTNIFESNDIMTDRRLAFMKNISSNPARNYFLPMKTCTFRPNHSVEYARVNSRQV